MRRQLISARIRNTSGRTCSTVHISAPADFYIYTDGDPLPMPAHASVKSENARRDARSGARCRHGVWPALHYREQPRAPSAQPPGLPLACFQHRNVHVCGARRMTVREDATKESHKKPNPCLATLCLRCLRGWIQIPPARAAWFQTPQMSAERMPTECALWCVNAPSASLCACNARS